MDVSIILSFISILISIVSLIIVLGRFGLSSRARLVSSATKQIMKFHDAMEKP